MTVFAHMVFLLDEWRFMGIHWDTRGLFSLQLHFFGVFFPLSSLIS